MKKFSVVAMVLLFLVACEKKDLEKLTLSKSELTGKTYTYFRGVHNGMYYSGGVAFRDYASMKFNNSNEFQVILRAGMPPNYLYVNDTSAYVLNETEARISFPEIDTLTWGSGAITPFYLADWILVEKTDSVLFFRSEHADTTRVGFYEATGRFGLKRN